MLIDVIIPVYNRPEIKEVLSFFSEQECVNKIIIGNNYSDCRETVAILSKYIENEKIMIIPITDKKFNRGSIINQCFFRTSAEYILVSDADILWNVRALSELQTISEDTIKIISKVRETHNIEMVENGHYNPLRFDVMSNGNSHIVIIDRAIRTISGVRPGYGLFLISRTNFDKMGGFNTFFDGWGWEDNDFIIRAKLFGFGIDYCGEVQHQSHPSKSNDITRNANLIKSIRNILSGSILGSLAIDGAVFHGDISVVFNSTIKDEIGYNYECSYTYK